MDSRLHLLREDRLPVKSPLRYLRASRRFVFVKEGMPGPVGTTAVLMPHGGHLADTTFEYLAHTVLETPQGNDEDRVTSRADRSSALWSIALLYVNRSSVVCGFSQLTDRASGSCPMSW